MEKTPNPAEPAEPKRKPDRQKQLDEALADSFPASDPVSIVTSQHEEAWDEDEPKKK